MELAVVAAVMVVLAIPAVRWRLRWRIPAAEYGAYMQSAAWSRRKRRWKRALRFVFFFWRRWCRHCWSRKVQLHHRTYKRLGHELHWDLVPLCREAHEVVTAMHRRPGVSVEVATAQFLAQTRVRVLDIAPAAVVGGVGLLLAFV